MNHMQFWDIIDKARTQAGSWKRMLVPLGEFLAELDTDELIMWNQIFREYQELSYKNKLWAAAYVIRGGCSDDSFDYFRAWLTAQGKEIFLNALADPDSLADVISPENDAEFESLLYAAAEVYQSRLNTVFSYLELEKYPLPDEIKTAIAVEIRYADDIDVEWNEEDLPGFVPRLWEACGWPNSSNDSQYLS